MLATPSVGSRSRGGHQAGRG